jgi:hypothetical protein
MTKFIRKLIAFLLLLCIVFALGLTAIILFPQPLFANKLEHGNFRVYANEKINEKIIDILDAAKDRAASSELYDRDYHYDILLSDGSFYNSIDDLVLGSGVAGRAVDNNVVIKIPVDIEHNIATGKRSRVNLTWLIAHEMVHCLQENRFGMFRFNPLHHPPVWKLEGYPEYVSRVDSRSVPSYSLIKEIEHYTELARSASDGWLEVEPGHRMPDSYVKGKLMIEYLIDEKGLTYQQILDEEIGEEQVYKEMMQWYAIRK